MNLEASPAMLTLALRDFGNQKHPLESNRYCLELAKASPLSTDLTAPAPRTNQQLRSDRQEEANAPGDILCTPVLVALTNSKRMVKQALTHHGILLSNPTSGQELL